jgi:hypothetical protein
MEDLRDIVAIVATFGAALFFAAMAWVGQRQR